MTIRNNAEVRQYADAEGVCRAAVEFFLDTGDEAIESSGRFTVALSGGSSPRRIYQLLAEPENAERLDWTRVQFFWGDERSVPPDHEDSNYRMAYEMMLGPLGISAGQLHRMPADAEDIARGARDYEQALAEVFGMDVASGQLPRFDLIMLGMGPDAHTASLFPETTALEVKNRWVVENYVPKFDTNRMTLTADLINRAHNVMFTLAGEDKAAPLAEVLEGAEDIRRLPSQMINPVDGRLLWLVDQAASRELHCLQT